MGTADKLSTTLSSTLFVRLPWAYYCGGPNSLENILYICAWQLSRHEWGNICIVYHTIEHTDNYYSCISVYYEKQVSLLSSWDSHKDCGGKHSRHSLWCILLSVRAWQSHEYDIQVVLICLRIHSCMWAIIDEWGKINIHMYLLPHPWAQTHHTNIISLKDRCLCYAHGLPQEQWRRG